MKSPAIRWTVVAVFLAVATLLAAQEVLNLQGSWDLTVAFSLLERAEGEEVAPDCEYRGTATTTQDGMSFSGTASLDLVEGIAECPGNMTAQLTGQASLNAPGQISGQLTSPDFGVSTFTGALVKAPGSFAGTNAVTSSPNGALVGAVGNWIAIGRLQSVEIPTLGGLGLVLLALLMLAAGFFYLRRTAGRGRAA